MKNGNMELKIARTRERMCQYELSHRTGISQGLISLIERGYRQPTKIQAERIVDALQVKADEIFPDLLLRGRNKENK
jgi:transcriptional regulator with XRE-family HTH domain